MAVYLVEFKSSCLFPEKFPAPFEYISGCCPWTWTSIHGPCIPDILAAVLVVMSYSASNNCHRSGDLEDGCGGFRTNPCRVFQAKYKEASKRQASTSLYHRLPETLETQHAKEASQLQSQVRTSTRAPCTFARRS